MKRTKRDFNTVFTLGSDRSRFEIIWIQTFTGGDHSNFLSFKVKVAILEGSSLSWKMLSSISYRISIGRQCITLLVQKAQASVCTLTRAKVCCALNKYIHFTKCSFKDKYFIKICLIWLLTKEKYRRIECHLGFVCQLALPFFHLLWAKYVKLDVWAEKHYRHSFSGIPWVRPYRSWPWMEYSCISSSSSHSRPSNHRVPSTRRKTTCVKVKLRLFIKYNRKGW